MRNKWILSCLIKRFLCSIGLLFVKWLSHVVFGDSQMLQSSYTNVLLWYNSPKESALLLVYCNFSACTGLGPSFTFEQRCKGTQGAHRNPQDPTGSHRIRQPKGTQGRENGWSQCSHKKNLANIALPFQPHPSDWHGMLRSKMLLPYYLRRLKRHRVIPSQTCQWWRRW